MKTQIKTNILYNAGSMRTTIPMMLVRLLVLKQGDKAIWNIDVTDNGININVEFEKKG